MLTEYRPWVDNDSLFTADFNNEVAFMALTCPKTVVAEYFGINWRTVGNCIKSTHDRLEPDVSRACVGSAAYAWMKPAIREASSILPLS